MANQNTQPKEETKDEVTPVVPETKDEPVIEEKEEVAEPVSEYNCKPCAGTGLKNQYAVCDTCGGTGKV